MSLAVPADLLSRAQAGEVDDAAFLDCVRASRPYAWNLIAGLVTGLEAGRAEFADNQVPPPVRTAGSPVKHHAPVRDHWTALSAGRGRGADPRRRTAAQPWPSRKNPAAITPT